MTEEEWLQDSVKAMARIGARTMHDAALSEWCQTLVKHRNPFTTCPDRVCKAVREIVNVEIQESDSSRIVK